VNQPVRDLIASGTAIAKTLPTTTQHPTARPGFVMISFLTPGGLRVAEVATENLVNSTEPLARVVASAVTVRSALLKQLQNPKQ